MSGDNLLLLGGSGVSAYQIQRSLRFNSADSAYLSRTPASAGNQKTYTVSVWFKRSAIGASGFSFLSVGTSTGSPRSDWGFNQDLLAIGFNPSGGAWLEVDTSALYRDVSAWYHVVVAVDTTQATSTDRVKLYVNGSLVTAFVSASYPSQNSDTLFNGTGVHAIGRYNAASNSYYSGYMAEYYMIDGQALTPSSFGQTNSNTGVWEPKAFSGTYGTNGYYLNFSDNSGTTSTTLGKDYSGNGNNWTPNNFSVSTGQVSVASATGGLPILNTTDTYGTTVGSGVRSDSFASSLVLAVAGATSSGLLLTDQIPSGRTQAAQSITNNGTTATTSTSKFYSGSATVANGQDFSVAYGSSMALGTTFTVEFWAKPDSSAGGTEKTISTYGINATDGYVIMVGQGGARFRSNGQDDLTWSGTVTDWTHFAFVASGGNSKKIYVNGTLVASNSNTINANGAYTTYIGSSSANGSPFRFTGQWQDYRIYKGVAKYTSDFTVVSSTPNPTTAAGYDSMVDTPTPYGIDTGAGGEVRGNYCTWNPLYGRDTLTNGNLDITVSAVGTAHPATMFVSSGKWYWEILLVDSNYARVGICNTDGANQSLGDTANGWCYLNDGRVYNNGVATSYGVSATNNDIINVALDLDAGKIWYGKNGTWMASGNPATGANPSQTFTAGQTMAPAVAYGFNTGSDAFTGNFGQRPFAYTAPSGFKALCTQNLSAPTVVQGDDYFNTVLYTGNGSTQSVTGVGFQPDFVWYKSRSSGSWNHGLFDVLRGTSKQLFSNTTGAEGTYSGVTSFDANGFTVGSDNGGNESGGSMVAWNWKANGAGVTNTAGSITSTVSASTTSGFSVVTYTGTGSAATVGHGLGAAPSMIIVKNRGVTTYWAVYHASLGNTKGIELNDTAAATTQTAYWNSTSPTSTVFTVNTDNRVNASTNTYVAYCFAAIPGYSAFGSYVGNGSSDGPFVYTGFRPAYILIKNTTSGTADWVVYDSVRNTYNTADNRLRPNSLSAELTRGAIDFLSNGMKMRNGSSSGYEEINTSGQTYIYAAFAQNPFKYALAR